MGQKGKLSNVSFKHLKMLCVSGWTDVMISEFFGVSRQTLAVWKRKYPDLADSMREWKKEADARVERSTYESACGYSHPDEKIFIHNKHIAEEREDGVIVRYNKAEVVKVQTIKHYPPNINAAKFWLTNRCSEDWRNTRTEEATDPLSVKIFNIMKNNSNGKKKAKGKNGVRPAVKVKRGGLQIVN